MEFYNFVSCEIKVWVMESHGKAIEKINSFIKNDRWVGNMVLIIK